MRFLRRLACAILLLTSSVAFAQGRFVPVEQSKYFHKDTLSKWEPHISIGTGFIGATFGSRAYTTVAPSVRYHLNDRLSFSAGFRVTSDFGFNHVHYMGSSNRNLAPYKQGGTGMVSAHASAEYQVNDRLTLAASVYHLGGSYSPLYCPMPGSMDLSLTAFTAAAGYRFSNDSFLNIYFTYINDRTGAAPYLFHDAFMSSGYGMWGMSPITNGYHLLGQMGCSPYYWGY